MASIWVEGPNGVKANGSRGPGQGVRFLAPVNFMLQLG